MNLMLRYSQSHNDFILFKKITQPVKDAGI